MTRCCCLPRPIQVASSGLVLDSILAQSPVCVHWSFNVSKIDALLSLCPFPVPVNMVFLLPSLGAFAVPCFRMSTWQVQLKTQTAFLVWSRFQGASVTYYPTSPSRPWILLLHSTYHCSCLLFLQLGCKLLVSECCLTCFTVLVPVQP